MLFSVILLFLINMSSRKTPTSNKYILFCQTPFVTCDGQVDTDISDHGSDHIAVSTAQRPEH